MDYAVRLQGIAKQYPHTSGDFVTVFYDFDLEVPKGSVTSIIGPSGCGKTTLLNIIAGLDAEFQGSAELSPSYAATSIGYMFQQHRLLPWRTVSENVRLALEVSGQTSDSNAVRTTLVQVGLSDFGEAYPNELSEGMRQRAAFARTLLVRSPLLLLDEPFASVDYEVRLQLEHIVRELARTAGTTVVFVSHDIEEAIVLGDRVVVLQGRPATVSEVREIAIPDALRHPVAARQTDEFRSQLGHLAKRIVKNHVE